MLIPAPGAYPVSGLDVIEAALRWLTGTGGKITCQPRSWLQNGHLAPGRTEFRLPDGTDSDGSPIDPRGGTAEVARRQPDTRTYVFDHPFGALPA